MKLLLTSSIKRVVCHLPKSISNKAALNELLLEMPRENKYTAALKNQRLKMKEKYSRYSPGTVNLQVLGSGAQGAPRSLYLFTDQSRYLFNCGEGSQRLAHEHKMKLSKLEHIFLTHPSWENIGGLPGVALTIQSVGVPEITLHGPAGIDEIFTATRRFVILKDLSIKTANCTEETSFEDNAIKVKYIPISVEGKERAPAVSLTRSPRSENETSEDEIDYYAHQRAASPKSKRRRRSSSLDPKSLRDRDMKLWLEVMCFAVTVQPRPGALCLEKCVEAGIQPGPLFGRLKAGEDVVLDDGRIVRSADVTLPSAPAPTFLVVECPNESFLSAFEREPAFRRYQMSASKSEEVAYLVVHFTPRDIMNHPLYRKWMDRFPPSTHHLILNEVNTCMGSTAVHRIQYKLNSIEPSIFPLLQDIGFSTNTSETTKATNGKVDVPTNGLKEFDLAKNYSVINGRTFYRIHLRPQKLLDNTQLLQINPEEYKSEMMNIDGLSSELVQLKTSLSNLNTKKDREYPNLVFLGTGSCIPNKARNTSAILVNMSEDASILLDCGEGTYGQLVRYFGPSKVSEVLARLRAIYVSHLHADHHIGLISILKAKTNLAGGNSLILLAPKQIQPWLTLYDKHFESVIHNLELIPNSDMLYDNYRLSNGCQGRLKDALDIKRIETTFVKHCPNAFGISISHKNGWKITYSGDTMPCEELTKIGANSDVLIHEATMEDELINEAISKLHSTTSQAIEMGRKMSAKYTILTHFSQRYAKLPRVVCNSNNKEEESTLSNDVGIAFDNMQVRFSDLPKLALLYPVLKRIFHKDCEELEQKALKRQLRQERANKKQKTNQGIS